MRCRVFTLVLALVAAGCDGVVTNDEAVIRFQAGVTLNPPVPRPGERVYYNVAVVNRGNQAVTANVEVLIHDGRSAELGRRLWEEVAFAPSDSYDLLGSFLTEQTSVGKQTFLTVRVLERADGGVLLASERVASFATSWDGGRVMTSVDGLDGGADGGGTKADGGR